MLGNYQTLNAIESRFKPEIGVTLEVSASPFIDSVSALEIAKRDLNYTAEDESRAMELLGEHLLKKGKRAVNAWLFVVPFQNQYRLVWIIGLRREPPPYFQAWEYWIDAHSGAILLKNEEYPGDVRRNMGVPVPDTQSLPIKKEGKSQDTTPKPEQESSNPVESAPSPVEGWRQVPPTELDSLRAIWKIPESNSNSPSPQRKIPESISLDTNRHPPPGIQRIEPVKVRLEIPIDSLIKTLKKQERPRGTSKKKDKKDDSLRSSSRAAQSSFISIMEEQFEFEFPEENPNWYVFDKNGIAGGVYFWDDEFYSPDNQGWTGWCAGGGADGQFLDPRFHNYPDSMDSWMVYGPFSLSDATDAELWFYAWDGRGDAQPFDNFSVLISTDSVNFSGSTIIYNQHQWIFNNIDLGSRAGQSGLWLAFRFTSNPILPSNDKGLFVENIVLFKNVPSGSRPDLAYYTPPGWDNSIVVSCCPGTNTQSQPILNQTAYIDWSMANMGLSNTSTRIVVTLSVDGQQVERRTFNPPFNSGASFSAQDIPYVFTTFGSHTITLEVDSLNAEIESNEFNNHRDYQFLLLGTGDNTGTGIGVLNNSQTHIDTRCYGATIRFRLDDFTRQLDNDPHGHHGHMAEFGYIQTARYNSGTGQINVMTDPDNIWNASDQVSGVDAHVYAGLVYTYLDSALNRNGFDWSGLDSVDTC